MSDITAISGDFEGVGEWYDSAGKSGTYQVLQSNRTLPAGLAISFRHNFDDGTVTAAQLMLHQVAPRIYRVAMAESPVGHGSWLEETLHYHLAVGGTFVEVGYRLSGRDLLVSGSSTKNAEGNYIVWAERLRRVPD